MLNKINAIEQKINDGKKLIANAITNKGVTTPVDSTLETMANNINSITGGGGLEPGSMIPSSMLEPPKETILNKLNSNYGCYNIYRINEDEVLLLNSYLTKYNFKTQEKTLAFLDNNYQITSEYAWHVDTENKTVFMLIGPYASANNGFLLFDYENMKQITHVKMSFTSSDVATSIVKHDGYYYVLLKNAKIYKINVNDISDYKIKDYKSDGGYGSAGYYIDIINDTIYVADHKSIFKFDLELNFLFKKQIETYGYNNYGVKIIHFNDKLYSASGGKLYEYNLDIELIKQTTIPDGYGTYIDQFDGKIILWKTDTYSFIYDPITEEVKRLNFGIAVICKLSDELYIAEQPSTNELILTDNNFNIIWKHPQLLKRVQGSSAYYNTKSWGWKFDEMCEFILDGDKIHTFAQNHSTVDIEPKYTIKAQTLAELPAVMSYIAKRYQDPCLKENCEEHK